MTRAWWRPRRHNTAPEATSADLSAEQPSQRHPAPTRLPTGVLAWICLTPSGGKFAFDHEQDARNRAAQTTGAVIYPAIVEPDEEMSA